MFNDELIKERKKYRLICELRHEPFIELLDARGNIIKEFRELFSEKIGDWRINELNCNFVNTLDKPTREFNIGFKRSSITYEDPTNLDEFFNDTYKLVRHLYQYSPDTFSKINRLGVRITSIFHIRDHADFEEVNSKMFTNYLASDLPFKENIIDNRLVFVYANSKIQLGPVDRSDKFISEAFNRPDDNTPDYGIALDVDTNKKFIDADEDTVITKSIKEIAEKNFDMENQFIKKLLD